MTPVRRAAVLVVVLCLVAAAAGAAGSAWAKACGMYAWNLTLVSVQVGDGGDSGVVSVEEAKWADIAVFEEGARHGNLSFDRAVDTAASPHETDLSLLVVEQ